MKLNLESQDGVSILGVAGEIDLHNFEILKAGLTKLFRSGKNRIILNLEDATSIDAPILRELAIIDVMARELSGKITLVSSYDDLKESVRLFARPPVVPIFSSVPLALEYFAKFAGDDLEDPVLLRQQLEAKDKELAEAKERLLSADENSLGKLRSENASLKNTISLLSGQVEALTKESRAPASDDGLLAKIHALEASLKRLGGSPAP
jgi:anti-anti-sigma factor